MDAFGLAGFQIGMYFSGLIQNHNARRMWQLPSIERILLKGNILKYSDIYQQKSSHITTI